MIRSCISTFYIAVFCLFASAQEDPDTLYSNRETLADATRAAAIWTTRLAADPKDFDAAWKLARGKYWLGTYGLPARDRKGALEAGVGAGRKAIAINPNRPEGHFWMAVNMGALAESFGIRHGLRYRTPVREALERVLKIDPAFLDGSADRALGRWYYKVPGLFGGSKRKSETHLRKALAANPQSIMTRLFLAETLIALDRPSEGRKELDAAIAAPVSADFAPEDRRLKLQAKSLLAKLPG